MRTITLLSFFATTGIAIAADQQLPCVPIDMPDGIGSTAPSQLRERVNTDYYDPIAKANWAELFGHDASYKLPSFIARVISPMNMPSISRAPYYVYVGKEFIAQTFKPDGQLKHQEQPPADIQFFALIRALKGLEFKYLFNHKELASQPSLQELLKTIGTTDRHDTIRTILHSTGARLKENDPRKEAYFMAALTAMAAQPDPEIEGKLALQLGTLYLHKEKPQQMMAEDFFDLAIKRGIDTALPLLGLYYESRAREHNSNNNYYASLLKKAKQLYEQAALKGIEHADIHLERIMPIENNDAQRQELQQLKTEQHKQMQLLQSLEERIAALETRNQEHAQALIKKGTQIKALNESKKRVIAQCKSMLAQKDEQCKAAIAECTAILLAEDTQRLKEIAQLRTELDAERQARLRLEVDAGQIQFP